MAAPMHRDTAREKVVNMGAKIKSQVKVVSYSTFMFERGMEKLKLNEHEGENQAESLAGGEVNCSTVVLLTVPVSS